MIHKELNRKKYKSVVKRSVKIGKYVGLESIILIRIHRRQLTENVNCVRGRLGLAFYRAHALVRIIPTRESVISLPKSTIVA